MRRLHLLLLSFLVVLVPPSLGVSPSLLALDRKVKRGPASPLEARLPVSPEYPTAKGKANEQQEVDIGGRKGVIPQMLHTNMDKPLGIEPVRVTSMKPAKTIGKTREQCEQEHDCDESKYFTVQPLLVTQVSDFPTGSSSPTSATDGECDCGRPSPPLHCGCPSTAQQLVAAQCICSEAKPCECDSPQRPPPVERRVKVVSEDEQLAGDERYKEDAEKQKDEERAKKHEERMEKLRETKGEGGAEDAEKKEKEEEDRFEKEGEERVAAAEAKALAKAKKAEKLAEVEQAKSTSAASLAPLEDEMREADKQSTEIRADVEATRAELAKMEKADEDGDDIGGDSAADEDLGSFEDGEHEHTDGHHAIREAERIMKIKDAQDDDLPPAEREALAEQKEHAGRGGAGAGCGRVHEKTVVFSSNCA